MKTVAGRVTCRSTLCRPTLPLRVLPARVRRAVLVRDHDDDEIIPIISGRLPCQEAPDFLPLPTHTMGGKTIGDELGLIYQAMQSADLDAEREMTDHLYSANWQGDVYTGSNWNILSFLMALIILVPVAGLLFAWLSYGTLWTGNYYGM